MKKAVSLCSQMPKSNSAWRPHLPWNTLVYNSLPLAQLRQILPAHSGILYSWNMDCRDPSKLLVPASVWSMYVRLGVSAAISIKTDRHAQTETYYLQNVKNKCKSVFFLSWQKGIFDSCLMLHLYFRVQTQGMQFVLMREFRNKFLRNRNFRSEG